MVHEMRVSLALYEERESQFFLHYVFASSIVVSHKQSPITSIFVMTTTMVVSGDADGNVKTWDVDNGHFRLLNAVKV